MKESKRYDFRRDGYTLHVIHTNSKYNKDKILKYLICEHYLLNNAYSLFTWYFPYRTPILSKYVFFYN